MSDKFLICEGDMDREVFGWLPKSADYGPILPEKPKPCTSRPPAGDRSAFRDAVRLLKANVPIVALALDLDSRTADDLFKAVEKDLTGEGVPFSGAAGRYDVEGTKFVVIPVGLPGNAHLAEFGIDAHAVDDYLVLLLRDRQTYDEVVRSNNRPAPDHAAALKAVRETAEFIRARGIAFTSSKQVLELFRAIIRFPATLASFAESILKHAPAPLRDTVLESLNDALP